MFREIVTKAIIGKGKKYFKNNYTITSENEPNTVLGCWVINHNFNGTKVKDKIEVKGNFDVNVWYSYNNDTKTDVVNKKIQYKDLVNIKNSDKLDEDVEVIVRSLKEPNCISVEVNDKGDIAFDIEKELGVELVGDTKVKIQVEETEEPWEIIDDSEEEIDKVVEDYIEKN